MPAAAVPTPGARTGSCALQEGKGWEPCFRTCSKTPGWVELGEEGSYK